MALFAHFGRIAKTVALKAVAKPKIERRGRTAGVMSGAVFMVCSITRRTAGLQAGRVIG